VVEDRVRIRRREVELDIGLDLAVRARRARVEEDAALLAGEIPLGAAAMSKADRRARAGREGMAVERDAGQIAGAALAVDKGLVEGALAVQRAANGTAFQVPDHRPDALAADAQRHLGARDHERAREAARHDRSRLGRPAAPPEEAVARADRSAVAAIPGWREDRLIHRLSR